jgi:hypothetical protein
MNRSNNLRLFYAAPSGTLIKATAIDRGTVSGIMTIVNKTTPVDEIMGRHNVFYPNPTSGVLKINEQFHTVSCSILDMKGKLIMSQETKPPILDISSYLT